MPDLALSPQHHGGADHGGADPGSVDGWGYLSMCNLYRVLACLTVLGQHSFIWADMSGNFVGTGFITMLHLSRNSFFFLTALVVTYAQVHHPRSVLGFWRRRSWQLGVPYLAWTGVYLVFSLITVEASWNEVGAFVRHNVPLGFSQMYFVVVVFEFYLLFPLLLKLACSTRRHWLMLATSLGFAMFVGTVEHSRSWFPPATHALLWLNSQLPMGRDVLSYQEFLVAGVLAALHLEEVIAFVGRHYRRIWAATVGVGLFEVGWYAHSVWSGTNVETASDIYEPTAVLWSLAAISGLFALSWWWSQHAGSRNAARTAHLAGLSGGVFFAHTIFINIIRAILDVTGLRTSLPWEAVVAVLFVGTVSITFAFSALVSRSPLRWVLGGPLRSEQRRAYATTYRTWPRSRGAPVRRQAAPAPLPVEYSA